MADSDRIEKEILLRAPKSRVWRALTDADEFGRWFGISLEGPFEEGRATRGKFAHPRYAEVVFEVVTERIEPEDLFSYRWHPGAVDPSVDYSKEPMTLVEFRLEEAEGGTRLTLVESGFDRIPAHRRDEAFRMDEAGWGAQVENIRRHVEGERDD